VVCKILRKKVNFGAVRDSKMAAVDCYVETHQHRDDKDIVFCLIFRPFLIFALFVCRLDLY